MQHTDTPAASLLVVDDDRRLRDLLTRYLKDQGFRVFSAATPAEARAHLAAHIPDLMILDIMMPGETGLDFLKRLRSARSTLPVILLTARDQLYDRVEGLDLGADDYIIKPFEPTELLSRIKAILRRTERGTPPLDAVLSFGPCTFNPQEGILRHPDGIVTLSSSELILLKTLSQIPGQALSRDELAQRIGHRVSDRTVDVQITRLRRKMGDDPRHPRYIQTVRHVGYALYPDPSP